MTISIVIPVYNEVDVVPLLIARLRPVVDRLDEEAEVIFVDDGSDDRSAELIARETTSWPAARLLRLATNRGHQAAITAGLDAATGDWVITMDADLQDPPELIPDLVARARSGVDIVYARRVDRRSDTLLKRTTAGIYYRLLRRLSKVDLPPHVGDFRLVSRRGVQMLRALPERHRVYRLLVPWLGLPSATVEYRREPRAAGTTKYPLNRMMLLAADSIASFSVEPLRVATRLGFVSVIAALGLAVGATIAWARGVTVPGWTSLTIVVLFLGAVQLVTLGILGEYIGRIYDEVRARPLYHVLPAPRQEAEDEAAQGRLSQSRILSPRTSPTTTPAAPSSRETSNPR